MWQQQRELIYLLEQPMGLASLVGAAGEIQILECKQRRVDNRIDG
jgi:hypothetical protein